MRVVLVGLGNAGHTLHLPALSRMSAVSVVGACDVDPARRARAAEAWRVPVFEDYRDMLAGTGPDLVVIGTPPDSHHAYCMAALASGADVICEKPFVSSVKEANEIIETAEASGRRVALNHEFREMPIFRAVRDRIGAPDVGPLTLVQVWQLMDLPPWAEPGWRGEMLQRTLYEAGVHLVDFVMALFREKPVAVSATVSTCGVRQSHSDAVALATLEFSRGRVAQITQNRLCKGETQYFEVRADCAEASVRASFGGRARLSTGLFRSTRPHLRFEYGVAGVAWVERGTRREMIERNPKEPGAVATQYVFEKTIEAFRSGAEPPASATVARDVLEVIAACYLSADEGRRIYLDGSSASRLADFRMGSSTT